jgi:hypothetical protein
MSDAWELLTANATDTTDAWLALNSQECGGGSTYGAAVDEIPFTLGEPIQLTATIASQELIGNIAIIAVTATVSPVNVTGTLTTESIPITEGC